MSVSTERQVAPPACIGAGQCGRIEIWPDQPGARRGFFDFGDQAIAALRRDAARAPPQTAAPAAPRRGWRPAPPLGPPPWRGRHGRACRRRCGRARRSSGGLRGRCRRVGARDEIVEHAACGARIDRRARQARRPRRDSRRGRRPAAPQRCSTARHRATVRPAPASRSCISRALCAGSPPRRSSSRPDGSPASCGGDFKGFDLAVVERGDRRRAGGGQLVEPVAMHDPGALAAEPAKHLGHRPHPFGGEHADQLAARREPGSTADPEG